MTAVSKNFYFDVLDTIHTSIKIKTTDVTSDVMSDC